MLEEDILYVTRQCRTLVLLLSKLNGKEFSQRSVLLRIIKDAQKYTANKADDQTQMKIRRNLYHLATATVLKGSCRC